MSGRDTVAQPPCRTEPLDEVAAGGVDVGRLLVAKLRHAPAFEIVGQPAVAVVEKRPFEVGAIAHLPLPGRRVRWSSAEAARCRRARKIGFGPIEGLSRTHPLIPPLQEEARLV